MEDLIMKIIDIEDRAKELIKDAREADRELEARLESETKTLEKDIVRKVEIKRETLKKMEDEDADRKIKEINSEAERQIESLNAKYAENKDKWVNEIVGNIIGG